MSTDNFGKKDDEIESFMENFLNVSFGEGHTRKASYVEKPEGFKLMHTCPFCKREIDPENLDKEFKDELSKREWQLSKLCQRCQDEVFADPEPEGEEEGDG